jgi:hypothetical protein
MSKIKLKRINEQIRVLSEELTPYIQQSTEYKALIDSAKTSTKKNHFKKKLTKNNNQILGLLTTLDKYNKLKEQYEETNEVDIEKA